MKYSLKDIYDLDKLTDITETHRLLEEYGILDEAPSSAHEGDDAGSASVTEPAVKKTPDAQVNESAQPARHRIINRDDLVLDRWRKMAGL